MNCMTGKVAVAVHRLSDATTLPDNGAKVVCLSTLARGCSRLQWPGAERYALRR